MVFKKLLLQVGIWCVCVCSRRVCIQSMFASSHLVVVAVNRPRHSRLCPCAPVKPVFWKMATEDPCV